MNFGMHYSLTQLPYSGLISRGEIFEVFMDFALSSKFKPRKFYDLLYIAITEVGRRLWWSQMTRKATLNKSGVYSKFSAKSRAEFTAEHTAIAASYIVQPAGNLPFLCTIRYPPSMHEISELIKSDRVKEYLQN